MHGLAHVTGGGIAGNLFRVLPHGCRAVVATATWEPPPVFAAVARLGRVPVDEMFGTFNMGVGFLAVTPPGDVDAVVRAFAGAGHDAWDAGEIRAGERGVELA